MYNRDLRKMRRSWRELIGVIIAIALLVTCGSFLSGLLFAPVSFLARPVWTVSNFVGTGWYNFLSFFQTKKTLISENNKLKEENIKLKVNLITNTQIDKDYYELKTLLGRLKTDEKLTVAGVLSVPNEMPYSSLILDIGNDNSNHKISVGDLVVYEGRVILGKITEVSGLSSKVKLLSSGGEKISVVIGNKKIPAEAKGEGGGNYTITLPKGAEVRRGDVIVATSYKNYLLGTVDYVKKSSSDPFQVILFKTPINIFQVRWLEIYAA